MKNLLIVIVTLASMQANAHVYNEPTKTNAVETVWDILSVLYDVGEVAVGYTTGNPALVHSGLTNLAIDAGSALVPGLPAGTGRLARVSYKAASKTATRVGTKANVNMFIKHVLDGHTIENAIKLGKNGFANVKNADDVAAMVLKVKQRIMDGYGTVQKRWCSVTNSHDTRIIVEMGEVIGFAKPSKLGKPRTKVSIIINRDINGHPHLGSMMPANNWNENGGFTNVIKSLK